MTPATIFEPLLADGLSRLRHRTGRVSNADVRMIFGPSVHCLALIVGANPVDATELLTDIEPGDVTPESLADLVRTVEALAEPPITFEEMKRRQSELEVEIG